MENQFRTMSAGTGDAARDSKWIQQNIEGAARHFESSTDKEVILVGLHDGARLQPGFYFTTKDLAFLQKRPSCKNTSKG